MKQSCMWGWPRSRLPNVHSHVRSHTTPRPSVLTWADIKENAKMTRWTPGTRTNSYGDERPVPYWVRLARIDGGVMEGGREDALQTMLLLDLRGCEYSLASTYRLAKTFDWLTRALRIRLDNLAEHCLIVTPLDPDLDFQVVDAETGRRPENWPTRRGEAFRWLPVPENEEQERYAWQR